METVCYTDGSSMQYPEVIPGVSRWASNDDKPQEETLVVTAHGLRRLLRMVHHAWPFVMVQLMKESGKGLYGRDTTPEKAAALSNELSSVFCEGSLVMSRLFVDKVGRAVVHSDAEVDKTSIPPWEIAVETAAKAETTEGGK